MLGVDPAEHRRDGVHMNVEWILLPAVGALIGWFTNFIAIRNASFDQGNPCGFLAASSFKECSRGG